MTQTKVLFVASEMAPLAQSGGLGDVIGALPHSLRESGVDARVIMPLYKKIKDRYIAKMTFVRWAMIKLGWRSMYSGLLKMEVDGVPVYFIDNEYYFGHEQIYIDYTFDIERFSFFQRAVIEAIGMPMDFSPDILHLNDWQTGMIPCLLNAHYRPYGFHTRLKTIFTIHNLKYQGIYGVERIADLMDLPERFLTDGGILKDGVPNFMKAGIVYADQLTTVSPTYATEILTDAFGEGLNGILANNAYKMHGILNGIDIRDYSPTTDPLLPARFSADDWQAGKAVCKTELQRELGLAVNPQMALAVMITRLVGQKGLDLLQKILDELLDSGIQLAVLGTGDSTYETLLADTASRRPGQMAATLTFDTALAHRMYAGADLFLMPSLFEPCGLSQLISMRYGTIPIVRETGGLKDTVMAYNQSTGKGNGFSFSNISAAEFMYAIRSAADLRHDAPQAWNGLVRNAMTTDSSWQKSANIYGLLYEEMISCH